MKKDQFIELLKVNYYIVDHAEIDQLFEDNHLHRIYFLSSKLKDGKYIVSWFSKKFKYFRRAGPLFETYDQLEAREFFDIAETVITKQGAIKNV